MERILIIALAVASLAISSCALMSHGTTEEIAVTSDPPGATATLASGETHVTPFTITVPREQDLQFHFSKPGYQSADIVDDTRVQGGYLAADSLTFFVGLSIDAATGAYFEHQEQSITARLDPASSTAPGGAVLSDGPAKSSSPSSQVTPAISAAGGNTN
ncbi:MAG TPA: hypothetical protein VGG60_11500 [Candidatus Binataceae bacterium]|jgi:hypothetical protein